LPRNDTAPWTVSTLTCPPLIRSSPNSAILVFAVNHESLMPALAPCTAPEAFCSILLVVLCAVTDAGAPTIATDAHTSTPRSLEQSIVPALPS
jgi:hypothetical protein